MFRKFLEWCEVDSHHWSIGTPSISGSYSKSNPPALRPRDFAYLECLAATELRRAEAAPIRVLLDACRIIAPHEDASKFIGLGSEVLFDVDSAPLVSRRIVAHGTASAPDDLSVLHPLACALLGRRGGDVIITETTGGESATVLIHSVQHLQ